MNAAKLILLDVNSAKLNLTKFCQNRCFHQADFLLTNLTKIRRVCQTRVTYDVICTKIAKTFKFADMFGDDVICLKIVRFSLI